MIADLGYELKAPTIVHEDNQVSIALASNPGFHARTNYVDMHHHFIREKIISNEIDVSYVETKK